MPGTSVDLAYPWYTQYGSKATAMRCTDTSTGWPTPGASARVPGQHEPSKRNEQATHHVSDTRQDVYASPPVRTPNFVSNLDASSMVTAGTNPRSTSRDVVSGVAFHPRAAWKNIIESRSLTEPLHGLVSCGHRPSKAHSSPVEAIGSSTASAGDNVDKSRLLPDGHNHKRSDDDAILLITLGPWLFASTCRAAA